MNAVPTVSNSSSSVSTCATGSGAPRLDGAVAPKIEAPYTYYLDPGLSLAERFTAACAEYTVAPEHREAMLAMLAPLRAKHLPTYEHCIRVGLLAAHIGEHLQLDARALFIAGVLHDCGKAQIPLELLEKTAGWSKADGVAMQDHVMQGYRLIRDRFDFAAEVILWHHRFQPNGYPVESPAPLHEYSSGTKVLIPNLGRILALADCYDALHRCNDHSGVKRALPGEEIREKMLTYNPDCRPLIERLFRNGVLTTFILGEAHQETIALDTADLDPQLPFLFELSRERTPDKTRRFVEIAAALEPLYAKNGCTTRYDDVSRHLKLAYFVLSGINIGAAFERLALTVANQAGDVPPQIYHHGYEAQLESKQNRRGGRVNQGIIELLIPIVAAQHWVDPRFEESPAQVLSAASRVLVHARRGDVDQLVRMKSLAHDLSHYDDRPIAKHPHAETIFDYYAAELEHSVSATGRAHNAEFVNGFPTVARMVELMQNSPYPFLHMKIEDAYHWGRAHHRPDVGSGFLADCIAASLYLWMSQNPRERIVG